MRHSYWAKEDPLRYAHILPLSSISGTHLTDRVYRPCLHPASFLRLQTNNSKVTRDAATSPPRMRPSPPTKRSW
jgi:hypothetical protein